MSFSCYKIVRYTFLCSFSCRLRIWSLKLNLNKLTLRNIEKTKKTLFNVKTQFFNDVRSKATSNPSGVIHKLKNKLNKIIKLLVLTNY